MACKTSLRGCEYLVDSGEIEAGGFKIALLHRSEEALVQAVRRPKKRV
jgi:hypothetical protein